MAGGLQWGWPAALIAIKPSVLPFLLVGVRRRSFWVAGAILGLASLTLWPLWPVYVTAIRNMELRSDYSLGSVTLLLMPIVAWFARRRPTEAPEPSGRSSLSTQGSPELH